MSKWMWMGDRVETPGGGSYRFGVVGTLELARIREELAIRGEAWAVLREAKLAFAGGRADYLDARSRLMDLLRSTAEVRESLEEVFGWLDLCFDGRPPIAELPWQEKLPFAIEALEHLEEWKAGEAARKAQGSGQTVAPMQETFATKA